MSIPSKSNVAHISNAIESALVQGDLSKLNTDERLQYYQRVCHSIGLNPLTQPFEYITLNGKLRLYAKRDCADQLRKINNISIEIVSQDVRDGLLNVHVRATDNSGRKDEDLGVVAFPDSLKGEGRANQILKAVTKAKRRVTLSISGLGFLDETEVDDIPQSAKVRPIGGPAAPQVAQIAQSDNPYPAAETAPLILEAEETLTEQQADELKRMIVERGANISRFIKWVRLAAPNVEKVEDIPQVYFDSCRDEIERIAK